MCKICKLIIVMVAIIVLGFNLSAYAANQIYPTSQAITTNKTLPSIEFASVREISSGVQFNIALNLNMGYDIDEIGVVHYKPYNNNYVAFPCPVASIDRGEYKMTIPYSWLSASEDYIFKCYCKIKGQDNIIVNDKVTYRLSDKTLPTLEIIDIGIYDSKLRAEIIVDSALDNLITSVQLKYGLSTIPIHTHADFIDVNDTDKQLPISNNSFGYNGRHRMYVTFDVPDNRNIAWCRIVVKNQKGKAKSSIYDIENGTVTIGNYGTIVKTYFWAIIATGVLSTAIGLRLKFKK